ncbi:MAG: PLDc N-terminal domain-containing protein [Jatrophihabitans sp.]
MVFFGGMLGLIALAVWVFCIIDAVTTPADQVRTLPKLVWIVVVVLLVDIGSIAWLLAGRPWAQPAAQRASGAPRSPGSAFGGGTAGGARPSSFGMSVRKPARRPSNPDDDEEFLAALTQRVSEQRRQADGTDDKPDDPAPTS